MSKSYLLEPNVVCLLSETLTAHVDPIFADETSFVRAGTAMIVSFTEQSRGRDEWSRTIDGCPYRMCEDARTRPIHETYLLGLY